MSLLARLTLVHGWGVLSALYVGKVLPNLKTGSPRLLAGVPILIVNTLAPCIFDPVSEFITRGCCLLLLTWLANFKVKAALRRLVDTKRHTARETFIFAYASFKNSNAKVTRSEVVSELRCKRSLYTP